MSETAEQEFEGLIDYLRRSRGVDFGAYKRPSLIRRMQKRMQTLGVDGYAAYTDRLEAHPEEFEHLFNTLLINVTAFFRDEPAWDCLRDDVLPGSFARVARHR